MLFAESNQPYLSWGHVKVDFLIATVLCRRRWYSPTRHMGLVFSFVHWIWKKKYISRVGHKHTPNRHWSFLTAITPKHREGQGPASCKSSNNNWKGGSYKSSVRIKFPRASTTQTTEKETTELVECHIPIHVTHIGKRGSRIMLLWRL